MTSDSAFNYFEILMLGMFAASWLVLEWQGKRLDRKRELEKAKQSETSQSDASRPPQPLLIRRPRSGRLEG